MIQDHVLAGEPGHLFDLLRRALRQSAVNDFGIDAGLIAHAADDLFQGADIVSDGVAHCQRRQHLQYFHRVPSSPSFAWSAAICACICSIAILVFFC